MRSVVILVGSALLILANSISAFALSQKDWDICHKGAPESAIPACTAFIAAGDYSRKIMTSAYFNRALSYVRKKNDKQGINDYSQAIKLKPDFFVAYINRGAAYKRQRKFGQSLADYNKAIRLQPGSSIAYHSRAEVYRLMEDFKRAIPDYNKAIALKPDDARVLHNRGAAYSDSGQYLKALKDFNRSIQLDPTVPVAYFNRGFAYEKSGNKQKAARDYRLILTRKWNRDASYSIGEAKDALKRLGALKGGK